MFTCNRNGKFRPRRILDIRLEIREMRISRLRPTPLPDRTWVLSCGWSGRGVARCRYENALSGIFQTDSYRALIIYNSHASTGFYINITTLIILYSFHIFLLRSIILDNSGRRCSGRSISRRDPPDLLSLHEFRKIRKQPQLRNGEFTGRYASFHFCIYFHLTVIALPSLVIHPRCKARFLSIETFRVKLPGCDRPIRRTR